MGGYRGRLRSRSGKLRPMADALEIDYDQIAMLAVLCRDAWEHKPVLPPPRTFRGTGGGYSQPHMLISRGRR